MHLPAEYLRFSKWLQLQEVPGLAQRMGSLMCVDIDLNSDAEPANNLEDVSKDATKVSAADLVAEELLKAKENGDTVRWLELEELGIDDNTLVSLDLSSKFPVCFHYIVNFVNFECVKECVNFIM